MARWDVEQIVKVQTAMEREFTSAITERGLQNWPIELRILCTAVPLIYREHLDDPEDDAQSLAELQGLVFQPLIDKAARHEAFRLSPEARVDVGSDVGALVRNRCRQYRAKLLSDLRKTKLLPSSPVQFEGLAFAAAQNIFAAAEDKSSKSSVFRNRMQAFIDLCAANVTGPSAAS